MTLRGALSFSAAFHAVLLIARSPLGLSLAEVTRPLEVSYLPAKPPEPVAALPQALRIPPVFSGADDSGSYPAARKFTPAPAQKADRSDAVSVSRPVVRPALEETPPRASAQRKPVQRWTEVAPPPLPKTSPLPRQEFAFVEHKERVRRHLKARLHYPTFSSDGTVRLQVLLDPEGQLKQVVVLETSDPRLASIAVQDAQGASPYPRFPSKVHPRQVRYEFLVRYKPA